MNSPGERLRWAREKAGFFTATDAARSYGWTVPTYLGHENGDRVPSRQNAKRYAQAFGVTWDWILEGENSGFDDLLDVAPIGYVGAGTEIVLSDPELQAIPSQLADQLMNRPNKILSIEVRGDALYPRYMDGEVFYFVRDGRDPVELLGKECVVRLKDRQLLLRLLRRGSISNRYHLESWCAPLIEDQDVAWAAPIKWRGEPTI